MSGLFLMRDGESSFLCIAKTQAKITRVLFPRIMEASAALGVSRITLYRVLKRQLPDRQNLQRRYAAFIKAAQGVSK